MNSSLLCRIPAVNRWRLCALFAIAVLYYAIPNARPDFSRFNCHDSESYVALSYSLSHGLGYTRSMIPGAYVGHTTWPPGVPVLLLPATWISGSRVSWLLLKWSIASVGIVGIVLAWLLVLRGWKLPVCADWSAAAVALNPFYWDFSHQCMAELPLTVWLIASILVAHYAWSERRPTFREAAGAGVFAGLGMLIKGHAAGLLFVPLAFLLWPGVTPLNRRQFALRYAAYVLCFLIPFLAWGIRNSVVQAPAFDGINQIRMIRAVDPCDASSPLMTTSQTLQVIRDNLLQHAIYRVPTQIIPGLWNEGLWKWKGSGFLYLPLAMLVVVLACSRNSVAIPVLLAAGPIAALNLQYPLGGSPRFWVPVTALLTVLVVASISGYITQQRRPVREILALIGACILIANVAWYITEHERQPYSRNGDWGDLVQMFETIARSPGGIRSVQVGHCHAFQLSTGIRSPMGIDRADLPVDHVILRAGTEESLLQLGAESVLSVGPWRLLRLPAPRRGSELPYNASREKGD